MPEREAGYYSDRAPPHLARELRGPAPRPRSQLVQVSSGVVRVSMGARIRLARGLARPHDAVSTATRGLLLPASAKHKWVREPTWLTRAWWRRVARRTPDISLAYRETAWTPHASVFTDTIGRGVGWWVKSVHGGAHGRAGMLMPRTGTGHGRHEEGASATDCPDVGERGRNAPERWTCDGRQRTTGRGSESESPSSASIELPR